MVYSWRKYSIYSYVTILWEQRTIILVITRTNQNKAEKRIANHEIMFFSYYLNHRWFIRKSFSILLFATCTFCQEKNDTKDKNLYSAPSLILCFIRNTFKKLHACKDSVLNRVKFRKLLYITKHYKILFSDINTIIMLFRADTTCKPLSLSSVL